MPKNKLNIVPVVLCGGSGTRLWPLSRESYPKQFLPLINKLSLFQQTLQRLDILRNIADYHIANPIIVTNEIHRFIVLEQLHEIGQSADIILEPIGKNTAPSLTLAALKVQDTYLDSILIVLPADHSVENENIFCKDLLLAIDSISNINDTIITLGVTPTKAETGYGYIKCNNNKRKNLYDVEQFVEKPDIESAKKYLESGGFFWNSGILVLKTNTWLNVIQLFSKSIYSSTLISWQERNYDLPFIRPNKSYFEKIPENSIDYAVLEHYPNKHFSMKMIVLNTGWSDLGSWQSVSEQLQTDDQGNIFYGDILSIETQNCYVYSAQRLVSLLGLNDLVVIDTQDALLITHKSHSQSVKKITNKLKNNNRSEIISHRKVYRPWGWYDSIDESERFKVKRICVKPKASLSLQKHHHRAEHWIIVKGTAEITCGDETKLLTENQSTYIPLGITHRLSNPGNIPLEIIEVQSGSYLGEDDIVRLDDDYGRE